MFKRHKRILEAAIVLVILIPLPVCACDIPVYEYALRFWSQDDYLLLLYHRGTLSPSHQAIANKLIQAASTEANIVFHAADLDDPDNPAARAFLGRVPEPTGLPSLAVHYPASSRIVREALTTDLSEDTLESLLDSPARQEIARRLLAGDAAVWVLLEVGDQESDDAAAQLIQQVIDDLDLFSTPTDSFSDEDGADEIPSLFDEVPSFSLKRLSRSDPDEETLIQLMLNSEADLRDLNVPIAFPIYGRGRMLYALVGRGITRENIEEACRFLTGPCSCLAKEDNPGIELLMNFDWETAVANQIYRVTTSVTLTSVSSIIDFASPESVPTVSSVSARLEPRTGSPLGRNLSIALIGFAFVIVGSVLAIRRRSR